MWHNWSEAKSRAPWFVESGQISKKYSKIRLFPPVSRSYISFKIHQFPPLSCRYTLCPMDLPAVFAVRSLSRCILRFCINRRWPQSPKAPKPPRHAHCYMRYCVHCHAHTVPQHFVSNYLPNASRFTPIPCFCTALLSQSRVSFFHLIGDEAPPSEMCAVKTLIAYKKELHLRRYSLPLYGQELIVICFRHKQPN